MHEIRFGAEGETAIIERAFKVVALVHSLEDTVDRIHSVSSLPTIVAQVLEVVNDDNSSVADLKRVVESDPALTSRVLRTVNSAAYGLRTSVDSIHKAIGLLGFNEVRNLAVTASVAEIFRQEELVGAYQRRGLWKHMVSVAIIARMVALRSGIKSFEEVFMGGLLHDLGIILIDQYLHADFVKMMKSLPEDKTLWMHEREVFGFDHTQLGARVGENWRFPASSIAVIRFHHDPQRAKPENRSLVQVVEVANFLCAKKKISSVGTRPLPSPDPASLATLKLGRQELGVMWQDMDKELDRHKSLIEM